MQCFFVSDLHGHAVRYARLLDAIAAERPDAVFIGGDILPGTFDRRWAVGGDGDDFISDFLVPRLSRLRDALGAAYPQVLVILGNDDPRFQEASVLHAAAQGVWTYCHDRKVVVGGYPVYGYAYVPPSPFQLKDWERYDVSRYVDPGCVSPEEGFRTVPVPSTEPRHATIQRDLDQLTGDDDLARAIVLFHSPPYDTALDRAQLDGRCVDHVPLDVHVGSIAIRRFIERRQPLVTLHGHIHESARLTGRWWDRLGDTHLFSAAHDGADLALIRFDPAVPESATRTLV